MQINGNIQIYANKKLITTGKNLITNSGKSIFLDWLSHGSYYKANLYKQNRLSNLYSGVSLSSQRFATGITYMSTNSNIDLSVLSQFQYTNNSTSIANDTIYMQLEGLTNISGICINASTDGTNYQYAREVKIYYSTQQVAIADNENKWNLVKIALNNFLDTSGNSSFKVIRFDNTDTADGYIYARSFKLQFDGYNNNYKLKLNGIGLLQKTPYPNVPCAIGLGNGVRTPQLTDTQLTSSICKLFVNKQLCQYEKNNIVNGVQTTEFKKLDLNHKSSEIQDLGINKINIVYISRIDYNQYNNRQFTEIGLFYPSSQVDYQKGADRSCNMMFSHGLFDQSWSKNNSQIIDIKYIISITV